MRTIEASKNGDRDRPKIRRTDSPESATARALAPAASGRRAVLLGLASATFSFGCSGSTPSGPAPSPTPKPSGTPTNLPNGIPNATALQNLALATRLARDFRPNAYLVRVEPNVDLTGVVLPGSVNNYIFAYPGGSLEDYWTVRADGAMSYSSQPHILRYDTDSDLAPSLMIDSPAAVTLALDYGLRRCVDRFSGGDWRLYLRYDSQRGVPTAAMRLLDSGSEVFGDVSISPKTGGLLFRDVFEKCG